MILMKITKKVTSLLLVMLLALSTFAVAITANAVDYPDATLHITKLVMPDYDSNKTNYNKLTESNGNQVAPEAYPTGAHPLSGVVFKVTYVGELES